MSDFRGATDIGEYLISARSFDEYRAMFALTDADLDGRILDCPGGGASFAATARSRGADVIAVDPVYTRPAPQLIAQLDHELARGSAFAAGNADRYVWDFYGSVDAHARLRAESARAFAGDLRSRPGRYVAARLPDLPFRDDAFDLVVSSHLLFTYADRLDADVHLAALRELARVGREVRLYPLVDQAGRPLSKLLTTVLRELGAAGLHVTVDAVDYEFQRGACSMLRIGRTDGPVVRPG
jgi:SAM-dependent methyltransferase